MATKPKDFTPHRRIEQDYRLSIEKYFARILNFPADATPDIILRAFRDIAKSKDVLATISLRLARQMITMVKVSNARSWREAARQSSRGREIYRALQYELTHGNIGPRLRELVEENAQLITSIPSKVREHVNVEIASLEQQGERPEYVAQFLRKRIPQLTRHQAALIARTETGKASTALTRARAEDIGIEWYQWQTSRDQRVRDSHRLMQSVLVRWDEPPAPEELAHEKSRAGHYNAGQIWNCRCESYPIISLDTISWPARVYTNSSIVRMTRAVFAEFSGMRKRLAA